MNASDSSEIFATGHIREFKKCRICPRNCGIDRLAGETGYCGTDADFHISSICLHRGEEPAVSGNHGICNIFFSRCNLSCIYCQNWQISCRKNVVDEVCHTLDEILDEIIPMLENGCKSVGFVSPSHNIPHVKIIIEALRGRGYFPTFVYNTGGYDRQDQIAGLEGYIDVYLPDFKYATNELAWKLSGAGNYLENALDALKEMYRQKGTTLIKDEDGRAESGMIIRHLILPGYVENSISVLRLIAEEISESVTLSLMAQYWPTDAVNQHPMLSRTLSQQEYDQVVKELEHLGFYKGWVQDLDSSDHYRPDFSQKHPFESEPAKG